MDWAPVKQLDLQALRHNVGVVRQHAQRAKIMAVVKADAYGHHIESVASSLRDVVDAFAVARLGEGVDLRSFVTDKPILVLAGAQDEGELHQAAAYALHLVVHAPEQLDMIERVRGVGPLCCWLKLDTGMHRLGFPPEKAAWALARLRTVAMVEGLMTHLANADDPQDDFTLIQLQRFAPIRQRFGLVASIANSAGILAWPQSHAEWVRPGLMLYGISPFGQPHPELRPVMQFKARIMAIRTVKSGEPVGYGGSWRAPRDSMLAVVGVGYGDGYPREVAPDASVLCRSQRLPVVGRVSMDSLTVDLQTFPHARIGDEVILWGQGLPVEEVARFAGTIPYTLCCGVSQRVHVECVS